ncbi:hypothetical protein HNQ77_004806 [Silvibacterium bohemicum]|uniref:Uncharacterized protein n=1 Tax=Silvibacterium bohemicum TaxID=1577686 RepID=A0A841K1F7_9BACT|nr:hypothetical protein [Silvibacterium bohemicum]MBB6146825.1 hypothetical protein [Silvibacterium bohemicum]
MSRSDYVRDNDALAKGRWRAQVRSSIRGKRGQKLLTDLLQALDQMPEKKLIANELETSNGALCALGVLGKARGLDMRNVDPEQYEEVASLFGITEQLTRQIVFMNDEFYDRDTPGQRYEKMRAWVSRQILPQSMNENPDRFASRASIRHN